MLRIKIGASVFFGCALAAGTAAAQATPDPADPKTPDTDTPVTHDDPNDGTAPTTPPPAAPVETIILPPPPPEKPVSTYVAPVTVNVEETEEGPASKLGIAVMFGGGVGGFTDGNMRDTAQVGGMWDVRAAFGTRSFLAIEAGYKGSAQGIDAVGLDNDAVLVGTTVEGLARVNLTPMAIAGPYVYGGAAWRRYDLTNTDTNTSAVTATDTVLELPVGIGLAYKMSGFIADVRGEYRMATNEDLIREDLSDPGENSTGLDNWSASARLGYEF